MATTQATSYHPTVVARLDGLRMRTSPTCHILRDDLSLGIVPYQDVRRYLRCKIESADGVVSAREISTGFTGERPYPNAAGELASFIRSAARTLVEFGEASYEVLIPETRDGQGRIFEVTAIMPTTLKRVFGLPYQILPSSGFFPELRRLGPERIFSINLPGITAGEWQRTMRILADIDGASLKGDLPTTGDWNFDAHRRLIETVQLKVTSIIPWVQRGGLKPKNMSDFYFAYRWLGMQRFVSCVRESIVASMNKMLTHVGLHYGFRAIIEVEGLPTASGIDTAVRDLLTGDVGPEAIERFIIR